MNDAATTVSLNGNWTSTETSKTPFKAEPGTLYINGNMSALSTWGLSVVAGTLGGTGTLPGGTTTIQSGAKLAPGTSPGTLTVPNLTLANGASYLFEGGDLTAVTGQLDLDNNWTLQLLQNGRLGDGGSVTLFTYGTLAAIPDLVPTFDLSQLGFTPSGSLSLIDTGSSIVLNGVQFIPEPSTIVLMLAGGLFLARVGQRPHQAYVPEPRSLDARYRGGRVSF